MSETKEPHVAGAPPDDTPAAVHTDPAPETDAPVQTEPEVKRKRGRPRKNPAPENESGNEAKDENAPQPNFVMSGDQRVLSIDSRRTVETDADKAKNNLLDLMESLRSKRILTGMIQGVEGNPDAEPRAVVYRGEFKILIPASLCIERPTDFRGMKPNDVLKYQITKRLGAEIEYIVKGIDPESGVVVASRMDAMAIRRRQFYFGKDRDGNNLIYEGCIAEARIICVIRTGAFIELFGQECFVPLQELGYQRMVDAMRHFAPGQRILVKVLRLDRTDPEHIKIELSAKQVSANQNEVWPYNLLCRIFNQEELEILKWNAPKELEAFLIYTVRDAYSDWEADIIVLHFMEQMPPEAIAKKMRRQKERIDEVIANAGDKLKDPLLMDTYRNGLAWRVTNELQKAYIAGYRKGYTHAIKGMEEKVGDHGNAFTNLFFDLPGHNHPVAFLEPSEETYNAMYFAGIHDVKELLEADDRKLMTEFRLDQSQINELAELLKKKGYSCILTRARNDITISYWPMNLLMGSLSETSAYHLMCYAPVDLKESFEFVRKVALNGKDEEILKLYYDLEFSLQDIAEELKITDTQVHERIVRALRKLRHPKYFDLIRYGMKTTVREMIRIESECGFQDGFHRGIEERWEDVDEETGEMNVPKDLIPWLQSTPIEDLQLPIRIINCLHRNKVVTVAELVQLRDKEIMAMNGMGKTAIKDIRKKQSAYIKELLIELVTNEITEISTREVVNNLGGTV